MSSFQKLVKKLFSDQIFRFVCYSFLFVLIVIITLDLLFQPSFGDVLVEMHGLLFDIFLFGLIIAGYEILISERNRIKRYEEELDDFRGWFSEESKYRVKGIIKRLKDLKVAKIDYTGLHLGAVDEEIVFEAIRNKDMIGSLEGRFFADIEFRDHFMAGLNLKNIHFINCKFINVNLWSAVFSGCEFINTEFIDSGIQFGQFSDAEFKKIKFDNCNIRYSNFKGAKFHNISFHNCDLLSSDFSDSEGVSSKFINSKLNYIYFNNARYQSLNFENSDFNASFKNVDLTKVEFLNMRIKSVLFFKGILDDIIFKDTTINYLKFTDIEISKLAFYKARLDKESVINFEESDNSIVQWFYDNFSLVDEDELTFKIEKRKFA